MEDILCQALLDYSMDLWGCCLFKVSHTLNSGNWPDCLTASMLVFVQFALPDPSGNRWDMQQVFSHVEDLLQRN
jgi:hypothetical protein